MRIRIETELLDDLAGQGSLVEVVEETDCVVFVFHHLS